MSAQLRPGARRKDSNLGLLPSPPVALTSDCAEMWAGRCALQVPGDVLLRWPSSADELRNGRGPALRLQTEERIAGVIELVTEKEL